MEESRQAENDAKVYILHLSDVHLRTANEAAKYRLQLTTDLRRELQVKRLDYLVISGDIGNKSTPDEYEAAVTLVGELMSRFGLESGRVVVVPGNHDLNWKLGVQAYQYVAQFELEGQERHGQEEQCIPAGDAGKLFRDERLYQQRFAYFSDVFYRKLHVGTPYPVEYAEQGILHECPSHRILFLALNSAWQIDHHYKQRCGINMDALTRALNRLDDLDCDAWLKIAVWHHPIAGTEAVGDDFLQLLAIYGFKIVMHGHIHEAREGFYRYDNRRQIHIVGAGTFGAPARQQVTGIPLQYNLLIFDPKARIITVETRRKDRADGAWSADARWGDMNNPVPRYTINLG